jgi:hypothetical protein
MTVVLLHSPATCSSAQDERQLHILHVSCLQKVKASIKQAGVQESFEVGEGGSVGNVR